VLAQRREIGDDRRHDQLGGHKLTQRQLAIEHEKASDAQQARTRQRLQP